MSKEFWSKKSKNINVIVDNNSWITPFAHDLVSLLNEKCHAALFVDNYQRVQEADISFYLGCMKITPQIVLDKSSKNLVVHESALPKGKGFSPLTWQILEGINSIPISLLEMDKKVDSGPVVLQDTMIFQGHELIDELRLIQGKKTVDLCLNYVEAEKMPIGKPQVGEETFYSRRRPEDSKVDLSSTLEDAFNLLRVVDNERYPAFFEKNSYRYKITITKENTL